MPLTKVKDRFQITIPSRIRQQLNLKVGDILETVLEDQRIVLRVKVMVDRSPALDPDRAAGPAEDQVPGRLPVSPSAEERRRLFQLLQGSAEDGQLDLPIEAIRSSRSRKKTVASLD